MKKFLLVFIICIATFELFSQATEHQVLHTPRFGDFFPPALPTISTLFPTTDLHGLPWFAAGDAITTTTTSNFGTPGISSSASISDQVIIEDVLNFAGHTNLQFRLVSQTSSTWKISYLYVDIDADPTMATLAASLASGATTSTSTPTYTPSASGDVYIRFYFSDDANSGDGQVQWKSDTQAWIDLTLTSLPIELISFKARNILNTVQLDWQTASETNNRLFIIERSTDQTSWEAINSAQGAGNATELRRYSVIDKSPLLGVSYYRLKQVDHDGKYTFSNIESIAINDSKNTSISIYPNPATDQLSIIGNQSELSQIKIFNVWGQDITALTDIRQTSSTQLAVNLPGLAKGLYYIKTNTMINKVYKH
jgi:hypothetical protein